MKTLIFVLPLIISGCRQQTPQEKGLCGTVTGTIASDPDYVLKDRNHTCEDAAIETPFDINSGSFSLAGLAAADVLADWEESADAWHSAGADLQVQTGDTASTLVVGFDGYDGLYNLGMYDGAADDLIPDYPVAALALTILSGPEGGYPDTSDCDIVFFSEDFDGVVWSYSANSAPSSSQLDLAYVLAHETGHCVGIGDQEHPAASSSLMFYSTGYGVDFAGLPASEVEAVCFLYGGPGC